MASLTTRELNIIFEETGLSKVSIQEWHKRFISECPTGNISKERYINLYRSYYPRSKDSDSYAEMLFTAFDEDRDQVLNFREFLRVVTISQGNDEKAKLELAYKAYNGNQSDGNLTRKDFQNALISILNLLENRDDADEKNDESKRQITIDWAMSRLGLDEKMEITKKEFLRRCRADPNLYEFLAFHCVPKPNCSDGDLRGKQKYQILVKTGSHGKRSLHSKTSSSDANVHLILHGEKQNSDVINLKHSQNHREPFENGHTDIFTQFLNELGQIKSITLWQTSEKPHAWFADHIVITNESTNSTAKFTIQHLFEAEDSDKQTKINIFPD